MPAMTLMPVMLRGDSDFPFVRAMIFSLVSLHGKTLSTVMADALRNYHRGGDSRFAT
jgi:hypothetical protein